VTVSFSRTPLRGISELGISVGDAELLKVAKYFPCI